PSLDHPGPHRGHHPQRHRLRRAHDPGGQRRADLQQERPGHRRGIRGAAEVRGQLLRGARHLRAGTARSSPRRTQEAGGLSAYTLRRMAGLAGVALAPVFYLLARRVLVTERAAVLATVLLLCDGVYLVQSRIAMTNIFAVLFQVSAALFILRAALRPRLSAPDMAAAG